MASISLLMSLCLVQHLPSALGVLQPGNGWFSKTNSHQGTLFNAREICKAFGYKGIDKCDAQSCGACDWQTLSSVLELAGTPCGIGQQRKEVICPEGGLCELKISSAVVKECESHDEPTNVMCPFGDEAAGGCNLQLGIISGLMGLFAFTCVGCYLHNCQGRRYEYYPGKGGNSELDLQTIDASSHKDSKLQSFAKEIWQGPLDIDIANTKGIDNAANLMELGNYLSAVGELCVVASRSRASKVVLPSLDLEIGFAKPAPVEISECLDQQNDEFEDDGACMDIPVEMAERIGQEIETCKTFVDDGDRMEMYSTSHKCWTLVTISVEVFEGSQKESDPVITYSAQNKCNRQSIGCVPIDRLRIPFDIGESIEVFTNGDRWLPAVVHGVQSKVATTVGYQVRLIKTDQVFSMVPAYRLRRRYPPGTILSVYKGCKKGWVDGVVHADAPLDGVGCAEIEFFLDATMVQIVGGSQQVGLAEIESIEHQDTFHRSRTSEVNTSFLPDRTKNARQNSVRLWVQVPVLCEGVVETFPSYLLRPQSKWQDAPNRTRWIV